MIHIRIFLGIAIAAGMIACSPQRVTPGALPTPDITRVAVTPAVAWLGLIFQRCAVDHPGMNLVVREVPANQLDPSNFDIAFRWGGADPMPAFSAVIGTDELALVVNPANPIVKLSVDQARDLFGGKIERWSQLAPWNLDGLLTVYRYAASDDVQAAADWLQVGLNAIFTPNPLAVRQAISTETYSLGYLPARWVDTTVKRVTLTGLEQVQISRPLLALAQSEPLGVRRAWLLCVQEQLK